MFLQLPLSLFQDWLKKPLLHYGTCSPDYWANKDTACQQHSVEMNGNEDFHTHTHAYTPVHKQQHLSVWLEAGPVAKLASEQLALSVSLSIWLYSVEGFMMVVKSHLRPRATLFCIYTTQTGGRQTGKRQTGERQMRLLLWHHQCVPIATWQPEPVNLRWTFITNEHQNWPVAASTSRLKTSHPHHTHLTFWQVKAHIWMVGWLRCI